MTRKEIIQLYKEKHIAERAYEIIEAKTDRIEKRLLGKLTTYSNTASLEQVYQFCQYAGSPAKEEIKNNTSWDSRKFKFLYWEVVGKKAIFLRKMALKLKISFRIETRGWSILNLLGYDNYEIKLRSLERESRNFNFVIKAPFNFYKNALNSTSTKMFTDRCAQRQDTIKKMKKIRKVSKALDGKV